MPKPAADRRRVSLVALAILAMALAALALRTVNEAAAAVAKPLPTADLESLTAFLAPLPDSTSLADPGRGTMVGDRDPFASTTPAPGGAVSRAGVPVSGPKTEGSQQWVVSSILFEESRRSAIVNDAWVSVGDPLGNGARVTAIERKYVIVTDANGNRHIVSIQGGAQ
jgi:hypothetical protein